MKVSEKVIEWRVSRTPISGGSGHCPSICNITIMPEKLDEFFEGLEGLEGSGSWEHIMWKLYDTSERPQPHIFYVGEEYHDIHIFRKAIRNLPGVLHVGVDLCDIQGMIIEQILFEAKMEMASMCIFCRKEVSSEAELILPVIVINSEGIVVRHEDKVSCERCRTNWVTSLIEIFEREIAQLRQEPLKSQTKLIQTTLDDGLRCLEEIKKLGTSHDKDMLLHKRLLDYWRKYLELSMKR